MFHYAHILVTLLAIAVAAASNPEGIEFLAQNKDKPGVVTTPSGLQYKILNRGAGKYPPAEKTPCNCHYEGKLLNGEVFDSSYERGEPTMFSPVQVIQGWREAMPMMVEGDKWELYIPSELAYGAEGAGDSIRPGDVLIFQMELLEILEGERVLAMKCDAKSKEDCNEREIKYIDKVAGWEATKVASEVERLAKMQSKSMKEELKEWITRRSKILAQLDGAPDDAKEL
uniref:peptidylprolyl isomerase n=1 Tax=Craspedostauros australis TaxID=1486917 RepID=A0A7R9WUW9_9STRA|mmetsp:Transcript_1980/g.5473  ORF Transcript_1980/g.5473 Transcript_1980/m.5473 type:complete len:228 (+) Transcript_1980:159-842(+)